MTQNKQDKCSPKHATSCKAVVAVVVVLPVHCPAIEVQVVGILHIRSVERTRPIVAVTAHVVHATIVSITYSRKEL